MAIVSRYDSAIMVGGAHENGTYLKRSHLQGGGEVNSAKGSLDAMSSILSLPRLFIPVYSIYRLMDFSVYVFKSLKLLC